MTNCLHTFDLSSLPSLKDFTSVPIITEENNKENIVPNFPDQLSVFQDASKLIQKSQQLPPLEIDLESINASKNIMCKDEPIQLSFNANNNNKYDQSKVNNSHQNASLKAHRYDPGPVPDLEIIPENLLLQRQSNQKDPKYEVDGDDDEEEEDDDDFDLSEHPDVLAAAEEHRIDDSQPRNSNDYRETSPKYSIDEDGDMFFQRLHMKCTHCDEAYSKTNDLYRHIRSHQNHTKCPHCGKILTCMATFVYHVRTHTGEKPYYCPVDGCDFRNAVKYNLKVHLASMRHGGKINLKKFATCLDLDVCETSLRKRKDNSVHELGSRRTKKRRKMQQQDTIKEEDYHNQLAASLLMNMGQQTQYNNFVDPSLNWSMDVKPFIGYSNGYDYSTFPMNALNTDYTGAFQNVMTVDYGNNVHNPVITATIVNDNDHNQMNNENMNNDMKPSESNNNSHNNNGLTEVSMSNPSTSASMSLPVLNNANLSSSTSYSPYPIYNTYSTYPNLWAPQTGDVTADTSKNEYYVANYCSEMESFAATCGFNPYTNTQYNPNITNATNTGNPNGMYNNNGYDCLVLVQNDNTNNNNNNNNNIQDKTISNDPPIPMTQQQTTQPFINLDFSSFHANGLENNAIYDPCSQWNSSQHQSSLSVAQIQTNSDYGNQIIDPSMSMNLGMIYNNGVSNGLYHNGFIDPASYMNITNYDIPNTLYNSGLQENKEHKQ